MGINTIPLDGEGKNPLKTNGLDRSKQDKMYSGIGQANTNGTTIMQTAYAFNLATLTTV